MSTATASALVMPTPLLQGGDALRPVDLIVIHCSASPDGRWVDAAEIDRWHRERGFLRQGPWRARHNPRLAAIGYHYVIYTNGAIATGRHPDEAGAHAAGHNARSLGLCVIGTDRFAPEQWRALAELLDALAARYPQARVIGHRDLPGVKKTCPGFDVADFLTRGAPAPEHVLEVAA
jgi:hypothetical protein